jgi:hypothetical protein
MEDMGSTHPVDVARMALGIKACSDILRTRMGAIIGANMVRKAVESIGKPEQMFTEEDYRVFRKHLLRSAEVFLDEKEVKELQALMNETAHGRTEVSAVGGGQ